MGKPTFGTSVYQANPEPLSFFDAEDVCQAQSSHLTSVLSMEENAFIYSLGSPLQATWVGGQLDHAAGSNLSWTDGSSTNFTLWMPNEPNNYLGTEACVAQGLLRSNRLEVASHWNDVQCASRLPYVCKTTYTRTAI